MRTHCTAGHPLNAKGRCQVCANAARQRLKARKYQDGLTPAERLDRAKRGWTKLDEYAKERSA